MPTITPQKVSLQGIIGGTFIWSFTLYVSKVTDNFRGIWLNSLAFSKNDSVLWSEGVPYRANLDNQGQDPTVVGPS